MAEIQAKTRTVYFAPTRGRHYLTLKAACRKEAGAMIERKYPTEIADREAGDRGWHWTQDERLILVRERLSMLLLRRARRSATDG